MLAKREFNFYGDIYAIISLTPECVELKKKNENNILKIISSNPFFKVLNNELVRRGVLATA